MAAKEGCCGWGGSGGGGARRGHSSLGLITIIYPHSGVSSCPSCLLLPSRRLKCEDRCGTSTKGKVEQGIG